MKFQAVCDGCDLCLMFSRGGGTRGQDDWSRGDCSTVDGGRRGGACEDFGRLALESDGPLVPGVTGKFAAWS
jgi:hypothetical protein